jgi:hypothetical protein
MFCPPPAALSLMLTYAICGIFSTEAVKVTLIVHDVLGAKEDPQLLVSVNSVGL